MHNMDYISSKNSTKINTIAILQIMKYMSEGLFRQRLEFLLKQILPDVHI